MDLALFDEDNIVHQNATRVTISLVIMCVLAGICFISIGALGSVSANMKWPKVVAGVSQPKWKTAQGSSGGKSAQIRNGPK